MTTSEVVLSNQIKSFDWRTWKVEFVEKAPLEIVEDVLAKIETLLT
jgi:mRNA interferase MazF